jgi:hypothetical protein
MSFFQPRYKNRGGNGEKGESGGIKDKIEKDKGEGIKDKGGVVFFSSSYPLSLIPFTHFPFSPIRMCLPS